MQPTTIVAFVTTKTSPEESIRRLVHATAHIEDMLSRSALNTLIQLTAMAHRTGQEVGIGVTSVTVPTADLDRLEFLGFVELDADSIAIELV